MGWRRNWTQKQIEQVFDMRDNQRMKWIDIARAFKMCGPGRDGPAAVCSAYTYGKNKYAREDAMRAKGIEPPKRLPRGANASSCHGNPIAAPPSVAKSLAAPIKRPRYFHDADAFVNARIERQGLTAGFLGDPPAGRSALDQRQGAK